MKQTASTQQMNMSSPSLDKIASHHVILALEASGDAVSVALMHNSLCLASKEHKARFGHAEHLVDLVSDVLAEADKQFSNITHIAAGCGPGSFTGLRVCLSAAKGYVLATQAQPVGVNGLAALALNTCLEGRCDLDLNSRMICFADTRRKSAFVQEFDTQGKALSSVSDQPFEQLSGWLEEAYRRAENRPVILSGLPEQLSCYVPAHDGFVQLHQPVNATMIARYAAQSLVAPDDFPSADFSPLYVVAPKLGPAKRQA